MGALIEVRHVRKTFGPKVALDDVSFTVEQGKTFVILGSSGGGKSTLLRIMIGAEQADSGEVILDGTEIGGATEQEMALARRKFGVLFQEGALLGSLSVGENVALPIRYHTNLPARTIEIMVKMKLELVGLREADKKLPSQLSGGMRKRAALARAIEIADHIVLLHRGKIAAQGSVPEILQNEDPLVRQFITGSATGPLEIRSSEGDYYNDLLNI